MNRIILSTLIVVFAINSQVPSTIDSLLNLVDTNKTDIETIDLYYKISTDFRLSENKRAVEFAQKGIQLSIALNDSLRIARGYLGLSNAYTNMGLYSKAMDLLIVSQKIVEKNHDSLLWGRILTSFGNLYYFQNNYPTALQFYKDALPFSIASKDNESEIILFFNIGLNYNHLKKEDSSMYYMHKALYLSQLTNHNNLYASVLLTIGSRFLDNDMYNIDSATYYLKKVKTYENNLAWQRRVALYNNLASLNMSLHKFEEAKNNLNIAENYAEESKSLYAKKAYLKHKFIYDTMTHNFKDAVNSQQLLMVLKDSVSSNELNDKIANFQVFYESEKKETEIQILKSNNEIYTLKNKQNSFIMGIMTLIFLFSIIILIIIFRSNKIKNKSIETLNQLNIELKAHREEMTALNEELSMNQEELYEKNKNLEELLTQLKQAQNHLIQSEKIASIGILARGVAHELINPLNFINGGISILQEAQDEDAQLQEKTAFPLQMMNEGIERAVNIVRQLSTFVDQGNTSPQLTNINQVIKSTLVFLNHRIDLETQVLEEYTEIGECQCFPDKIHAIMFQLLINALDELKEITTPKILKINTSVTTINTREFIEIKVWNSGKPICDENLPKLFDPFFTTKDANKGTGLGLTLVYNLVKEQQGIITAHNSDNGVLFTVSIPKVL